MIINESTKANRIGIFVFYNRYGYLEDYVDYLLKSIRPHLAKLYIVSNCRLQDRTRSILKKYSDDIFVRENHGLDAEAFKKAIMEYCGLDEIRKYDELICFNDTVYGPIVPFEDILNKMSKKDIDFWGIMAGYESFDPWGFFEEGYIPAHIQSWFWAFRKTVTCSAVFEDYWLNYNDEWNTFWDIVRNHEIKFTRYLEKNGFSWDVFTESNKYRAKSAKQNYNFYAYGIEKALKKMEFPFLKRKPFAMERSELIGANACQDVRRGLEYLKSLNSYPIDMIYRDILHNYNVFDIYSALNLNYILVDKAVAGKTHESGTLILIKCRSKESLEFILPYIEGIADCFNVYLCLGDASLEAELPDELHQKIKILLEDADRGLLTLKEIQNLEKYKYVVFADDVYKMRRDEAITIYESILYVFFENMMKSANYLNSVIELLATNHKLGLLMTPTPVHSRYRDFLYDSWMGTYDMVQAATKRLNLRCNLSPDKPIISASGCFCCRREILDKLINTKYCPKSYRDITNMDITLRMLQFAAQDREYYTGVVMSDEYGAVEDITLKYYINDLHKELTVKCQELEYERSSEKIDYDKYPFFKRMCLYFLTDWGKGKEYCRYMLSKRHQHILDVLIWIYRVTRGGYRAVVRKPKSGIGKCS